MLFVWIVIILLLVLALVALALSVKVVRESEQWTVETFGRYTRTLEPGLHLLIPFVERIGHKQSMREKVLEIPEQEVITRDNVSIRADLVTFYLITNARFASYEVENLERAITNLATTNIRTVIGAMDLDEVLSNREDINRQLSDWILEATGPWGVKVTRLEIRDLTPPEDIVRSMAKQMKAEREKRAEILEAEGLKFSAILRAQGERDSLVAQAEGRRDAALLDAEARVRLAGAEAEATQQLAAQMEGPGALAANYFVAQRYVDSLRDVASADNAKIIMMPVETMGVVSTIAGIGEIAREALAKPDSDGKG